MNLGVGGVELIDFNRKFQICSTYCGRFRY